MQNFENVIDLCEYRAKRFPSAEEVRSDLTAAMMHSDIDEAQVAEALLELFESGQLDVSKSIDGEFLYSIKKEFSGTSQEIYE